jgi:hypothetical protein
MSSKGWKHFTLEKFKSLRWFNGLRVEVNYLAAFAPLRALRETNNKKKFNSLRLFNSLRV